MHCSVIDNDLNIHSGATTRFLGNIFDTRIAVTAAGGAGTTIDLTRNFWGTTNSTTIGGKIHDAVDDSSLPRVVFDPPLATPDSHLFGITVMPSAGLTTSEAGGTASFSVRLDAPPISEVTIRLTSSDPGEGDVLTRELTFSPSDWSTPKPVTVVGTNDFIDDDDVVYSILMEASSFDACYDGKTRQSAPITNLDDGDTAGIVVRPTSGLTTSEAGGTATFEVTLTSQPTAPVTIPLRSSAPSEGTAAPGILTFTAANWDVPQTVTVTGADDAIQDGTTSYTIVTDVASSADPKYGGMNAADVSVTNADDGDRAGIAISPTSGLTTTEAGGRATFTVVLQSEPTASVTITLSSTSGTEGAVRPSLVFKPANWDRPQTVTVTGIDDSVDDGDVAYTIVTAASSTDPDYDGRDVSDISLINIDDDTAGVTITPRGLTTTEADGPGRVARFTVVLDSQPQGDVTIRVQSGDESEGVVDVGSLIFTPKDWDVPRTVTVTGVGDDIDDGDVSYEVRLETIASDDRAYPIGVLPPVRVTNLDVRPSTVGDYDGDGLPDLAVYVYDTAIGSGRFEIRQSSDGTTRIERLGGPRDVPVTGDFDGDGKADVAVFHPEFDLNGDGTTDAGAWTIRFSSNGQIRTIAFGAPGTLDRPAPADYDGDGRTDIATFRPDSDLIPGAAEWFILPSGPNPGYETTDGAFRLQFGAAGGVDLPAPADYDGDGVDDIATFRPAPHPLDPADSAGNAQWFVLPSGSNAPLYGQGESREGGFRVVFGASGGEDQPVIGDYDDDGRADIAAFRSASDLPDAAGRSDWFILRSATRSGFRVTFGTAGNIGAPADYDGDGELDLAVFDPASGQWALRRSTDARDESMTFGPIGGVPVLAPLAFRLAATGNTPGGTTTRTLSSGDGPRNGSAALRASRLDPGLFMFDRQSATSNASRPPTDRGRADEGRWAELFDRVLDEWDRFDLDGH